VLGFDTYHIKASADSDSARAVKSCQKTHPCNCRQQRLTVYT